MSKLHKIVAPQLTDVGFGDNIKTQFGNINENFQKLGNYDFTKGEKGDSITIEDVKLKDDESIKKDIFSTLWEYRSQYLIDSEDDDINKKEDQFLEKTEYNIESYLENATFRYIVQNDERIGSLPFIYVDERFHHKGVSDHIKENVDLYDDEIDLSCVIMYNNGSYEIVRNFPNLYYDEDVKQLCWQWLGKQTGVLAQGPQGPQGTSTKLLISTIGEIREDGLALVTSINVSGNVYGDIQQNEDGTRTYNGILVNDDATKKGLYKNLNLADGENIVGWPTIVLPNNLDNNNLDNVIYVTQFQSVKDENDQEKYYVTVNKSNIVDLGFSIDKFWQKTIETPLAKGRGFALPVYKETDDKVSQQTTWDKENGGTVNLLYTHPLNNSLIFKKTDIDKNFNSDYITAGIDKINSGLNIYYDTTIWPIGAGGSHNDPISFTRNGIKFKDSVSSAGTSINRTTIKARTIEAFRQFKVGSETTPADYVNIFSKKTIINSPLINIKGTTSITGDATITGTTSITGDATITGVLKTQNMENSDQITSNTIKVNEDIHTPRLNVYDRINVPKLMKNGTNITLSNGVDIISSTKFVKIGNNVDDKSSITWGNLRQNIESIEFVIDADKINHNCIFIIYAPNILNIKGGENIISNMIGVGRQNDKFYKWFIRKNPDTGVLYNTDGEEIDLNDGKLKINISNVHLSAPLTDNARFYIYPLNTTSGVYGTWFPDLDRKDTQATVHPGGLHWQTPGEIEGGSGSGGTTGGDSGSGSGGTTGGEVTIYNYNAIQYHEIIVNCDILFKNINGSIYHRLTSAGVYLLHNIKLPVVSSAKFNNGNFYFSIFESISKGNVKYSSNYYDSTYIYNVNSYQCWVTNESPFGNTTGNFISNFFNANLISSGTTMPNYIGSLVASNEMKFVSGVLSGDHTVDIYGKLNVSSNIKSKNITAESLTITEGDIETANIENANFDSLKVNGSQEGQILMADGNVTNVKPMYIQGPSFSSQNNSGDTKHYFEYNQGNREFCCNPGSKTETFDKLQANLKNINSPEQIGSITDIKLSYVKFFNFVNVDLCIPQTSLAGATISGSNVKFNWSDHVRNIEIYNIQNATKHHHLPDPVHPQYVNFIVTYKGSGFKEDDAQMGGIVEVTAKSSDTNFNIKISGVYHPGREGVATSDIHVSFTYICK